MVIVASVSFPDLGVSVSIFHHYLSLLYIYFADSFYQEVKEVCFNSQFAKIKEKITNGWLISLIYFFLTYLKKPVFSIFMLIW